MSKYIIDTGDYLFTTDGVLVVGFDCDNKPATFYNSLDTLEELNSDYINEHFGDLQDTAYQKGFEDGKAVNDKGCEGCKYANVAGTHEPCVRCSNSYGNQWTAKSGKIEVGDEVDWSGDKFIVTRIFQPHDKAEECDGVDMDGCTYHDVIMSGLTKTGRHVDITDMLKGALE